MTARTSPSLPSVPAELARWRRETPGCRDRIHLNNAGAALMPQAVLQAVTGHLEREAAIGGYEAEDEAEPKVRETYELLGRVVGAAARNMAIVENATVAFSQAMSAFDFQPGDRIVTTRADYPSNQLTYLSLARRAGVETVRADDLPEGGVDPASVRRLARHARTRLVALSWVPTNSGLVQDAGAVGEVCAELGVPYLIDACQAVGQLAVDVAALRCDFLAGTGRKFLRGPRGIGFLYVSDRVLDRGRERCAIVSVGVAGRDAADLKLRLRDRGINASSADRMSGVLDMDDKGVTSVLRFSPHYYNTEDELDAAVRALAELARS